jgi:hypothetical protein
LGDDICDTNTAPAGNWCALSAAAVLVFTNVNGTASINDLAANRTVPVGQSITATATKVAPPHKHLMVQRGATLRQGHPLEKPRRTTGPRGRYLREALWSGL